MTLDNQVTKTLTTEDFTSAGTPDSKDTEVALVVQSAAVAEAYLTENQWKTQWAQSDILYQSPQPFTFYNNSYILEPNVRKFTIATTVNSIVPQFLAGTFSQDPPFVLKSRPNTPQDVIYAKEALFAYLLNKTNFKRESKWGLEQMTHQGTGIWKWGVRYSTTRKPSRKSQKIELPAGQTASTTATDIVYQDTRPEITYTDQKVCEPFIEHCDITRVFVDPKTGHGDIREAGFVVYQSWMDFYDLQKLREDPSYTIAADDELKKLFDAPTSTGTSTIEQTTYNNGTVLHAQQPTEGVANPLAKKLEVLEYSSPTQTIVVLDRKTCIKSCTNELGCIPYLSANYWNVPNSFYGMGCGQLAAGSQVVEQTSTNSALKILSFNVNAPYMAQNNGDIPTQPVITGLGKIVRVTDLAKGYKLMETPRVPADLWPVLQETKAATDESTGADSRLVGGSMAPGTSMGRTAGGASILAGASANRLNGPLDNFLDQVFIPWLYILDKLIFTEMSDAQIMNILGTELGPEYESLDLAVYHDAKTKFDVLAGARVAAKAGMAQSLTLLTQLFDNPEHAKNLADINGEYIDFKPLFKMYLEMSGWGAGVTADLIKPLTPEMKQARAQQNGVAEKLQAQAALQQQKGLQAEQLQEQKSDARLKEDLVRQALKSSSLSEAVSGTPNPSGFGSPTNA